MSRPARDLVLLAGSTHPQLSEAMARRLEVTLCPRTLDAFPDGEQRVELLREVRGRDVFIVQSLRGPVGEHLLELLLLSDAARRGGAARVIGVLPYLAYARQDRRESEGLPLGARVIADTVGAALDAAVVVDLHSPPVEGCFSIPVEHVSCVKLLADHVRGNPEGSVVVAPDLGAAKRAERFARSQQLPVAIVHKSRVSGAEVHANGVVGRVKGLSPVLFDDIISTAGTIEAAAGVLLEAGCTPDITVCATHGLFVAPAMQRLQALPLRRVIVTDSVPPPVNATFPLEVVSVAPLLSDAVLRIHGGSAGG